MLTVRHHAVSPLIGAISCSIRFETPVVVTGIYVGVATFLGFELHKTLETENIF